MAQSRQTIGMPPRADIMKMLPPKAMPATPAMPMRPMMPAQASPMAANRSRRAQAPGQLKKRPGYQKPA